MKPSERMKTTWGRGDLTTAEKYGRITGNEAWGEGMAKHIPEHMQPGLCRFILFGIPAGDFLTAVLENDFMRAAGRADDVNRNALLGYIMFLYNYAPTGCYGDTDRVHAWLGMAHRADEAEEAQ